MITLETMDDIRSFIANEVMFTSEAASYLGITNQRLNQLVQSGKLLPVKVNRSGSIFLKTDLDERKKELLLVDGNPLSLSGQKQKKGGNHLKFGNQPKIIHEAINYYTVQTFYKSDKKAEPFFEILKNHFDLTEPLYNKLDDIAQFMNVSADDLNQEYQKVSRGFDSLRDTDYVVKKGQDLYPTLLAKTKEAPPFLFMRGNVRLLNQPTVAVVGTRNPSDEGIKKAWNLARLLGKFRIVVASGLAKGIDTAAHTGALHNKYPTISVIGTPITKFYPKENEKLQQQIAEEGLVISQFPPSSSVQRWNFPLRNSVMSGISLATVVVEAGETSGALIQADYALKQGRLVFIPQSAISNPKIAWPKKLILKPGAKSFSKIDELLSQLEESKVIQSEGDLFDTSSNHQIVGTDYVSGS